MIALIFANGSITNPSRLPEHDMLIAADGGANHCRRLGLTPDWVIGDLDSTDIALLEQLQAAGTRVLRFPVRKDFTDLELAVLHAQDLGATQVVILAALGRRWDQTLANLLLPAATQFSSLQVKLLDGPQEITLIRPGEVRSICGQPGDTLSLIPLIGDARGITTTGLEYPLQDEDLLFGSTRGISNVLLGTCAEIKLNSGMLICTLIHHDGESTDET